MAHNYSIASFKLRDKLENRQETKSRTEEYRSWQKEFEPKKQAVRITFNLNDVIYFDTY